MTYSAVPPPPDLTRDSAVSPYMKNRTLSDIRAITATVWNMTDTYYTTYYQEFIYNSCYYILVIHSKFSCFGIKSIEGSHEHSLCL